MIALKRIALEIKYYDQNNNEIQCYYKNYPFLKIWSCLKERTLEFCGLTPSMQIVQMLSVTESHSRGEA